MPIIVGRQSLNSAAAPNPRRSNMRIPETTPVIVGVGEFVDRPQSPAAGLEPVALIENAVRSACADSGGDLLSRIESIELVGLITWRYENPVGLLCQRLGIAPAHQINTSMGGETPIRLVHDAAIRIAKGELSVAAIVGGEAMNSMNRARKERAKLDWTPLASKEDAVRFDADFIEISPLSKTLGITDPLQMYPLYEIAAEFAWGETPAQGRAASANLWAQFARVAADNPSAWIRTAPNADVIGTTNTDNRLIAWPYSKLMVANPSVNQGSAIIVTSLAAARAAGVPEDRLIYVWGGAAAAEPANYLRRDRYDRSSAQAAALQGAVELAGGDAKQFSKMELYSCFPIVPKLALRELGLDSAAHTPTVTGGLTFFGGPLNNYMSHATCAM
ncbi:conserved hypothetical protein, partial [Ricinus communis]